MRRGTESDRLIRPRRGDTRRPAAACGRATPRERPPRGFTLVELLVVIAMMATLTSILFPAFVQAREAARQTTCASNLRQLGEGFLLYVEEYDGRWPGIWNGHWNAREGEQLNWAAAILPQVKHRRVYKCPS